MDKSYVIGLFKNSEQTAKAIKVLKDSKWSLERVHSPFADHKIMDALGLKKSRVGYFTLAGGILGFISGFSLAIFTATRWSLIVSGKPVISLIPFFIIGFEFTILFSVLGNIIGLFLLGGLPDYKGLKYHESKCTGDHFGIVATCSEKEQQGLMDFFKNLGGESRVLENDIGFR